MHANSWVRLAAIASSTVLLASCGGSDDTVYVTVPQQTTPTPPPIPIQDSAGAYLQALPKWDEFSPPVDPSDTKVGASATGTERVDIQLKDADGNVIGVRPEQYTCITTKYSITSTPEKIVMFSPDRELLWPGALVQGRSHRDGVGSLLPLTIAERAPIKVSIPSLATGENYRTVDTPDQAEVNQAIGAMVGNATTGNLAAPSSIQFTMSDYTSEQSFALNAGLSGKYLGFSGSASGSVETKANEHTVMVHFLEKMFEVVVEPPQSPGAFFSADFTRARLDEQIAMGRIGPANLPVYVSNVVYGRMMAFTLTSTASETDIKAALNAAYKGIFEVNFNLKTEYKDILQNSKITVTSLGGSASATIAMIASGNWRDYFTEPAPLTSAYPLSYTFRNLGDGSIAKVAESTEYDIKECTSQNTAGFILDSFEAPGVVNWTTATTAQFPVELAWGNPSTPQSIFYGYFHALHFNRLSNDLNNYDIGYIVSPDFTGLKSDWYRGELTYWYKPDERLQTIGQVSLRYCYIDITWVLFIPVPTVRCVMLEVPRSQFEDVLPTSHKVLVQDGYTTADQIVLRGGGTADNEVLTLTYTQKEEEFPLKWTKHAIRFSNEDAAGTLLCNPPSTTRGCWMVEDRLATEYEIQYVLKNVTQLRLRASYPALGVVRVCAVDPVPAAGCPSYVDTTTPIFLGYVGGFFDEIKLTKAPFTGY